MDLNSSDFGMVAGAMRHAGFRLVRAQYHGAELTVYVTGANMTVDGLDRGNQKAASGRYLSPADDRTEIPWPELNHSEKFQVIGDILSILRR